MSSDQFQAFALAVHMRYNELAKGELFVSNAQKDLIWETYLNAFPEGTNPKFRTNTEHDCSCCRQFIKNLGRVVAIDENYRIQTVWDNWQDLPEPYATVSRTLADYVGSHAIETAFFTEEPSFGAELNIERLDNGGTYRWHHFHGKTPRVLLTNSPGTSRGNVDAAAQVFGRGLREITPLAIDTVIDLIDSNALYRGAEHREAVAALRAFQLAFNEHSQSPNFVWKNCRGRHALVRNTVIGKLLVDLSNDVPVEDAVRSFEAMVAPQNYRRPTAIVTQAMVNQAMKTIEEHGLEPALERRHATLADVSINDVLWASGSSKQRMRGGVANLLAKEVATKAPREAALQELHIDDFLANVVPKAIEMELLVHNHHRSNFLSITAPVHDDAPKLFKWNNGFSWSYAGDVTDALKERVKAAGGNVDAKLRFSLGWYNYDDLDLHVKGPRGHVFFANEYAGGGVLDVDMNAGFGHSRTPVENIVYANPVDGAYKASVVQYNRRESVDIGFEMQLAVDGSVINLRYPKLVSGEVHVATVTIKNGKAVTVIADGMEESTRSVDHWGVKTETFVPVSTMLLSPNYWHGDSAGNKHWIFLLEGCRNPDPVRSIYNEYLNSAASAHGKVFELLGARTKAPYAADQLSGVGFSSTRNDKITVRVKTDKSTRTFSVSF